MGDGEGALSDAYQCRMMRPDWAKACYRQAAAHMLLKVRLASQRDGQNATRPWGVGLVHHTR